MDRSLTREHVLQPPFPSVAQRLHCSTSTETPTRHLPLTIDLCREDTRMPSRQNDHAQPADAIAMLKADHQRVKDLFAQYEAADNVETKRTLADQVFRGLDTHTQL